MNAHQTEVYQLIQQFSLDNPDDSFPFSQKLARENGWTVEYTQRAINEYKKFIFLAVVAGHAATPSDQVDRVWHLHLTYTHSYWDEFCANVLQKQLHHHPTRGGSSEQEKYRKCYKETLISYEKFFSQHPPADIWSAPDARFDNDVQFKRLNTERYWIVPKPSFSFPELPSIYLPRLHLRKFMAIALLSFILVLAISSFMLVTVEVSTLTTQSQNSELALSQTVENSAVPSNSPTSTPQNKDRPTEKKSSWGFFWWIPLLIIFPLFGSRGNNSDNNRNDDNNDGGFGCTCM
jgi:hypothetical protein